MPRSRIGALLVVFYLLVPVLIFIVNWLYRSNDEAILIYFMLLGTPWTLITGVIMGWLGIRSETFLFIVSLVSIGFNAWLCYRAGAWLQHRWQATLEARSQNAS